MTDREGGFDGFVRLRAPSLLRTAYLLTGDRDGAERTLGRALQGVWRDWRRLAEGGRAERAALRRVVELARPVPSRPPGAPLPAGIGVGGPDRIAARRDLRAGLARLSRGQRTVVVLQYADGLSPAEIAALLGRPPAEVELTRQEALHALEPADPAALTSLLPELVPAEPPPPHWGPVLRRRAAARRRRTVLGAAGVLAALGLVAVVLVLGQGTSPRPAAAPAPSLTPVTPAPVPTPSPSPTPSPTPRPTPVFAAPGATVTLSYSVADAAARELRFVVRVHDNDGYLLSGTIDFGDGSHAALPPSAGTCSGAGTAPQPSTTTRVLTHSYPAGYGHRAVTVRATVTTGSSCRPTPKESPSASTALTVP